MSTITLPNIRVSSDLTVKVRLKDSGVAIDWSTLTKIKASIYSDAQRALAGRCDVSIDAEDSTILVCNYAANKPQYVGVNRIVVSAKYMGETKTYDKPAFTFVRWTADQEGEQITIDDPDVDVEISVEDISSSILQEAVDAAFEAADRANDAAAAAEHMVDIHTGPEGKSAYEVAVEEGYVGTEEEWLASLVGPQGQQGIQGETGEAAGFGTVSVSLQEDGGQPSATVAASGADTAKSFAFTFNNLKGEKGDKGDQGNSGYQGAAGELEVVNNLTDGGSTAALSAEMGKTLEGEVSQLEAKMDDKLDAPEITNNEYVRVYVDAENKILFAITNDGNVIFNNGIALTDKDYTDEDKIIVKASRFVDSVEWSELITDKNGIPLFGIKTNGSLYPNMPGEIATLKKDVLKHRVPFDQPIDETIVLPDSYNNVIATAYSYILEIITEGGSDYFHFSKDLGKTWETHPNTIGDITHTHIFSDGTILLCGRRKAYYTKDFVTMTESVLYDADGSIISNLSRDSFFTMGHHDVYNLVNGKEIDIWGEYVLERNQNPKIWYTIDNGETVRSAFTFGVSEIDGSVVDCRHIHKVTYCKKDNTFYATTGDAYSSNEDHVLAGNINVNNNTWEWRHIADGRMFKFGIPFFDEVFMYVVTDYTEAALYDKKGILYTPISGLGQIDSDIDKFNYAYRFPVDEALTDVGAVMAPFDIVIDGVGNKVLFGDYQAYGFIWFANKGFEFKRFRLSRKMFLGANILGPNFNGDIYIQAFGDGVTYTNEYFKLNRGRGYNLTEILRSNGIEDFMKQSNTKYNF